jgi:hypothetical protein
LPLCLIKKSDKVIREAVDAQLHAFVLNLTITGRVLVSFSVRPFYRQERNYVTRRKEVWVSHVAGLNKLDRRGKFIALARNRT